MGSPAAAEAILWQCESDSLVISLHNAADIVELLHRAYPALKVSYANRSYV